tara:strand:- start:217 stop:888 length:672 start_codon:yes stop_codon:yes gene_type:complete
MDKDKVIIIGSSGHSKVVIDLFEKEGKYDIIGLIDDFREIGGETLGYKVLRGDLDVPELLKINPDAKLFVAIGDNWIRKIVVDKFESMIPNVTFATVVHPSAQIGKNVILGKGIAIMAGAIINSSSLIGDFTIINTKASIDHDCEMGDFSSLAPNVTTGGNVSIGSYSAISISATVLQGVSVGTHCVIGAGALLLKSCEDNLVLYGSPAKEIRSRNIGDTYMR